MPETLSSAPSAAAPAPFAARLHAWFRVHGRHDLPWQHPRTPYRVWLSEIMLQQTGVAVVKDYFARFTRRFPTVDALAAAPADDVMAEWAGLGYYARARNLHQGAKHLAAHGWPATVEGWQQVPGVGRTTAGAVVSQALDRPEAVLDANIRRVLARHAAVPGWPGETAVQARLWQEAEARLPPGPGGGADHTQAMMDLGALVCTPRRPACGACPAAADCQAFQHHRPEAFPAPKPARARPHRHGWLLVLEDPATGAWFAHRRPGTGIWGGLWTLPAVIAPAPDETPESHADAVLGLPSTARVPGARPETIEHGFSHYDLTLEVVRLHAIPTAASQGPDRGWHAPAKLADGSLGLPAPVAKWVRKTLGPRAPEQAALF